MRFRSPSMGDSAGLNLSIPGNKATSQFPLLRDKGYGAILKTLQAMHEVIKEDIKGIRIGLAERLDHLDMQVAAIDEQLNEYHDDILCSAGDQSPTQPRWRPWFPLQTVTDMTKMEQNLQNENCKADVVAFIQRTPAGTIKERTRVLPC
ncbi:unnamed protein product [Calicophoron daubneyi]|uniref:Uncharacterized protein n=1 Tax=Calicophoron daubneyi TaxID=300641 RepID=A0AAV2TAT1_CALDB